MKTQSPNTTCATRSRCRLLGMICSLWAVIPVVMSAQTYTWTGNEVNDSWTTSGNWLEGTPVGGEDTLLVFGAANQYLSYNDITGLRVRSLTFSADAGQYVIDGDYILVAGENGQYQGVYNNSLYMQTILVPLALHVGVSVLDTGRHGLTLGLIGTDWAHSVIKRGSGDLILTGDMTDWAGVSTKLIVENGRVVVDIESGAELKSGTHLAFGDFFVGEKGTLTAEVAFLGSTTQVTTVALGDLFAVNGNAIPTGLSTIRADSNGGPGLNLEFVSWMYPGNKHFDISSGNASIAFTGGWVGEIYYGTVKDENQTGFAVLDGGLITRYTSQTELTAIDAGNGNYKTSGNLTLLNNHWQVSTLTIQGAGTMDGAPMFGIQHGLLMEEGVGDYTIDVGSLYYWNGAVNPTFWNYSLVGSLIINSPLGVSASANSFTKAGPGLVIINHAQNTQLAGGLYVQEGPLQLDGGLARASEVYVYNTATLSGKGVIGDVAHFTPVRILDGGTLDATNEEAKALSIHGTLRLDDEATYRMVLSDNTFAALQVIKNPLTVDPVVYVSGDLSLSLALDYVHQADTWIYLLTTDGIISGQFLTVNGQYFAGAGNEFELDGYEFRIFYDHDLGGGMTAIALHAIPEPSTVALLLGVGLAGLVYTRKRLSSIRSK